MTETRTGDTDSAVLQPSGRRSAPLVGTVLTLVPQVSPGAPKRNTIVGLAYLLVLWVLSARILLVL